jgi:hypothetical protein
MQARPCLYVSYDGLLDPLGQSQILPYINGLAAGGYSFIVLSFEKAERTEVQLADLRRELQAAGVQWITLPFKQGRLEYLKRIIQGAWRLRILARRQPLSLVHSRTILPASMVILAGIKAPLIYDIRAFAGEWIDAGRLKRGSVQARLFSWLEDHLISTAAGLVVLDQSGADYLRTAYPSLKVPVKVIPTCTSLDVFADQDSLAATLQPRGPYRFVFLGGARFPYRPDLAFLLLKQLLSEGIDCTIDFINERDQDVISAAQQQLDFPAERCQVFSLDQSDVSAALRSYHSGFVFNTAGHWRSMSSPTKLGEYLGAGLHVIGLSGIHALHRLAAEDPMAVDVIRESALRAGLSPDRLRTILSHIQMADRGARARKLARRHYDMALAHQKYRDLYAQVLRRR